jgi:DNA adenine methylase
MPTDSLFPWVGNKKKHLQLIKENLPTGWNQEKKKYVEPFLGSAVVFQELRPPRAIINDKSTHLMDIYRSMQQDAHSFHAMLKDLYKNNCEELHTLCKKEVVTTKSLLERSAKFLYLLRTSLYSFVCLKKDGSSFTCCYRESTGGRELKVKDEVYWDLSKVLSGTNVKLFNEDFSSIIDKAQEGDFLFIDPPYMNDKRPSRKIYDRFSTEDHQRLVKKIIEADRRGVYIMMFNHNHPYLLEQLPKFKRISVQHTELRKGNNQFADYQEVLYMNY